MDESITSLNPSNGRRNLKFFLLLIPVSVALFALFLYLQSTNKVVTEPTPEKNENDDSVFGNVKEKNPEIVDYKYFTSYTKDKDGNQVLSAITSTVLDIQGKSISLEKKNDSPLVVDTSANFSFYKYKKDLNDPLEIAEFSEIKKDMTVTIFFDYNSSDNKVVFRFLE
ncbi:MAG: hypothetical protein A2Z35_01100 [Actinobacteria bacterium RBG_19FT_COMBO_36_27]|nr:MAG: hypothetical protein A2Z35_01100 [Actinobacteria bacterium RBG_19FT_COMBO_36_27]